MFIANIAYCKH